MLKKIIIIEIVFFFIIVFATCSGSKEVKVAANEFSQISNFLQSLIDTSGIPGIAIAITNKNEVIYSNAFGVTNIDSKEKLTPMHIFHVASVSKTFAATAVMQLYEKGKIDINKPLVTYLPYFKLNDGRYTTITIKQMLNHTSGMPDVEDYEWEKAFADEGAAEQYTRSIHDHKLVSSPGQEYHYSNMAFDVFADLVSKVSGKSFELYVKGNILQPLAMNESSFYAPEINPGLRTSPHTGTPPKVSAVYPYNRKHTPSSTLNTNVLELSNWAIANMNDGQYKSFQLLTPPKHAMMMTPTFQIDKSRNLSIGISWFMYPYQGAMNYEHGGSDLGYKSILTLIPERGLGLIILSNYDETKMYDLRNKVRDILLQKNDKK